MAIQNVQSYVPSNNGTSIKSTLPHYTKKKQNVAPADVNQPQKPWGQRNWHKVVVGVGSGIFGLVGFWNYYTKKLDHQTMLLYNCKLICDNYNKLMYQAAQTYHQAMQVPLDKIDQLKFYQQLFSVECRKENDMCQKIDNIFEKNILTCQEGNALFEKTLQQARADILPNQTQAFADHVKALQGLSDLELQCTRCRGR